MIYDINKLPDFYSVRNFEQIDYAFADMQGKKCYCFFDNGFSSNIIEPNKREIKFIWDGFILFTDKDCSLQDIEQGIDLSNARLVALQRTSVIGEKFNNHNVRNYILEKLESYGITYEIMPDTRMVEGYPSKCDLWSTRDSSVLLDAMDCTGDGDAYYFKNDDFKFEIVFNISKIPKFLYSHQGALVLKGANDVAISRLLCNDKELIKYLSGIVGEEKIYSFLEGKNLPGITISNLESSVKKL